MQTTANFSSEPTKAGTQRNGIFKILKRKSVKVESTYNENTF